MQQESGQQERQEAGNATQQSKLGDIVQGYQERDGPYSPVAQHLSKQYPGIGGDDKRVGGD